MQQKYIGQYKIKTLLEETKIQFLFSISILTFYLIVIPNFCSIFAVRLDNIVSNSMHFSSSQQTLENDFRCVTMDKCEIINLMIFQMKVDSHQLSQFFEMSSNQQSPQSSLELSKGTEDINRENKIKQKGNHRLLLLLVAISMVVLLWPVRKIYVEYQIGCSYLDQVNLTQSYPDISEAEAQQLFKEAQMKVKQAVSLEEDSGYMKNSVTEEYKFPTPKWTANPPQLLNLSLFPQAEMNNFMEEIQKCGSRQLKVGQDRARDVRFGWNLFNNPNDPKYQVAQYLLYDQKYNISRVSKQQPLCIFSSSKNLYTRGVYKEFLLSLARQNYTNFHVVLIDDHSTDNSVPYLYAFVDQYTPDLRSKIVFIKNRQRLGSFANKDYGIKENCGDDDIVVDIDADDSIVGRQAFNVINAVYGKDVWVVYSSYFSYEAGRPKSGISGPLLIPSSEYRLQRNFWSTSHLKTYRTEIYKKIPLNYLTELHPNPETKTKTRQYQRYSSDMAVLISLVELSGNERVFFLPEPLYAYRKYSQVEEDAYCHRVHQFYDEFKIRMKKPLKKMQSINDMVKSVSNHIEKPYSLMLRVERTKQIYMRQCEGTRVESANKYIWAFL